MKADYWNITEEQVVEKTGKNLAHWTTVLNRFGGATKKSTDTVAYLQNEHNVPRYWARTLTTRFIKSSE